jgi:hypothetical protein
VPAGARDEEVREGHAPHPAALRAGGAEEEPGRRRDGGEHRGEHQRLPERGDERLAVLDGVGAEHDALDVGVGVDDDAEEVEGDEEAEPGVGDLEPAEGAGVGAGKAQREVEGDGHRAEAGGDAHLLPGDGAGGRVAVAEHRGEVVEGAEQEQRAEAAGLGLRAAEEPHERELREYEDVDGQPREGDAREGVHARGWSVPRKSSAGPRAAKLSPREGPWWNPSR